jgi:zinc protease
VDLQRALAGKAASVNPFIDELEQGFQGSASSKDLETMLQMIYLTFTSPRFDAQASAALVDRIRAALANRSAAPEAAYSDTVQVTLSQNHPRYAPLSTAMLTQLDQQRAFAFFKDRFSDANGFTFVFVGNIDPAAMKPLVEKYLGGLPTAGRRETYRDTGVRPPRGVVNKTVRQGLEPRAQTEIVFSGTMPYTRENRYAIRSLSDVLEIRLQEVLREDMGGTYGVQTVGNAMNRPEQRYQFIIAFGAAPAQLETLVTALFRELERIKTEGPSADDIQKVREIQRRERETSIRQNGYWLGQISGYAREGLNFADIPRYEELVEGLNADIVKNAAKQLLDAQNYVRVSLLPAAGSFN